MSLRNSCEDSGPQTDGSERVCMGEGGSETSCHAVDGAAGTSAVQADWKVVPAGWMEWSTRRTGPGMPMSGQLAQDLRCLVPCALSE